MNNNKWFFQDLNKNIETFTRNDTVFLSFSNFSGHAFDDISILVDFEALHFQQLK